MTYFSITGPISGVATPQDVQRVEILAKGNRQLLLAYLKLQNPDMIINCPQCGVEVQIIHHENEELVFGHYMGTYSESTHEWKPFGEKKCE